MAEHRIERRESMLVELRGEVVRRGARRGRRRAAGAVVVLAAFGSFAAWLAIPSATVDQSETVAGGPDDSPGDARSVRNVEWLASPPARPLEIASDEELLKALREARGEGAGLIRVNGRIYATPPARPGVG